MQQYYKSFKEYQKPAVHLLVWAVLFALPFIFALQIEDGGQKSIFARKILVLNTVMNGLWVLTFYLNSWAYIPILLYRRKILLYFIANLLLFLGILFVNQKIYIALSLDQPYSLSKALLFNAIPFLFVVLISIVLKTVTDRIRMESTTKERESENLKTELSFLRSQVSPHFLFNVLNNAVAMARLKSDKLEPTLLKLSSLLQYMLYETDEEKVVLKSEIEYLQNYIDLQTQRFGDRLQLNVHLQPKEDWQVIEPMLLIPFVENAFKHGTGMIGNPVIDISLYTANNQLTFIVKNKYIAGDKAKDKVSGIGLTNVKRRLQLLYGKNHSLDINKANNLFIVTLKLNFKP